MLEVQWKSLKGLAAKVVKHVKCTERCEPELRVEFMIKTCITNEQKQTSRLSTFSYSSATLSGEPKRGGWTLEQ